MAKKALCLSGGATRGSFQIGAIKCLYEVFGFRPDIITGTSIGAINGIKLACAPPPSVNDAAAILAAVTGGTVDEQLKHMRALEKFWIDLNGRKEFFTINGKFAGTLIDDALKENSTGTSNLKTEITMVGASLYFPLVHVIGGVLTTIALSKIESLIGNVMVANSIANLSSVQEKLRNVNNINVGKLFSGTPLLMAMVSLETGKLRYATNTGEFLERDGVSAVFSALMKRDVDVALDESSQALANVRKDRIKLCIAKYEASVAEIAASRTEYNNPNTKFSRKQELDVVDKRARARGDYYAAEAKQALQGVKITSLVRNIDPMKGTMFDPDPIKAAIASASLPVLIEPQQIGAERYVDAGLRENIPIEVLFSRNVDQIVGILCGRPELPETDSKEAVGLIDIGMRAAIDITINEVIRGDQRTVTPSNIGITIIAPEVDVHNGIDLKPSEVEISMNYGWLRAADEMQPGAAEDLRKEFRHSSELITRLRMRCLELEVEARSFAAKTALGVDLGKERYFDLRVRRWAIMHVVARRSALGLPPHPAQAIWSTLWEREHRNGSSVWGNLDVLWAGNNGIQSLVPVWPASSPASFNPDFGTLEDAGSDRIDRMVRGAIFEDKSGTPPANASPNVVVPTGLHKMLPKIPTGVHLMAETQAPGSVFLVGDGKKFAAPSSALIARAGLTGAPVALVPTGGLAQIPDGVIPSFLGDLTLVNRWDKPLPEVILVRVQQSISLVELRVFNRSTHILNSITITAVDFPQEAGLSVEAHPTSIPPNTTDAITLRLQPTKSGDFEGRLRMATPDDLVLPVVYASIKLTVLPLGDMANLGFSPDPLIVSGRVNSTPSSILTITNSSAVTPSKLSAFFESKDAQSLFGFLVGLPAASEFTQGKPVQIPISFHPTIPGEPAGKLVLHVEGTTSANRPYRFPLEIPLQGKAIASRIRLSKTRQRPRPRPLPGVPDVDVWGPGVPQPNPADSSLTIDLGTIPRSIMANVTSFFIANTGDAPMEISGIVGGHATIASNSNVLTPLIINPGDEAEIPLDFEGTQLPLGLFTNKCRIFCDDPMTPEAAVILTGRIAGADARLVPPSFRFDPVAVNTAATTNIALENTGTVDLILNQISWGTQSVFKIVQPADPRIAAGTSLTLAVEFLSPSIGEYSDELRIEVSDGINTFSRDFAAQAQAF